MIRLVPLLRARIATALAAGLAAFAPASFAAADASAQTAPSARPQTEPTRPAEEAAPAKQEPGKAESQGATLPDSPREFVVMETSMGPIVLELDREKAPISVANFLAYVDKGFYDETIFHRVIGTFMIQGGGFTTDLVQKETDKPIKNEWQNGLKNMRGTIAMARTPVPDSATSQFFINVVDNPVLDQPRGGAAYAVFGKVIGGMQTVDRIKAVPTGTKTATTPGGKVPFQDVPLEAVVIRKVTRVTEEAAKAAVAAAK
jgi:cyclophilin family peptidyl-prolyl cis-trans isomerase